MSFLNSSFFLDSLTFMGSGVEIKLLYFCFSHYLQWAPVPLSHGVLVDRHKASSLNKCSIFQPISGEICLMSMFWHLQRPAQLHTHHPKPTFWMTPVDQTPYGLLPTPENLFRDQRFPSQTRLSKAPLRHHLQNATAGHSLFQRTCLGAGPPGTQVHPRFGPRSNVAAKVEEHPVQALEPALCHFVVPVPPSPLHPYTPLLALPSLA